MSAGSCWMTTLALRLAAIRSNRSIEASVSVRLWLMAAECWRCDTAIELNTLAIEAYNLAKDERLAEAALPSLAIVAAGLLPVIYVSRRYFQATRS